MPAKDTKSSKPSSPQEQDQPEQDAPQGDPSEVQQGVQQAVPEYNDAGQELGDDGAPVDGPKGLIMTTQDGTITTAEQEAGIGDGGQDS